MVGRWSVIVPSTVQLRAAIWRHLEKDKLRAPLHGVLSAKEGMKGKEKELHQKRYVHHGIEGLPKLAGKRSCLEHFEGGLEYSSCHKLYIISLVDRRLRLLIIGISKIKKTTEVAHYARSTS